MTTMAFQITSLTVVYSTVYSDADQRKHQSSASLAFVWGTHRDRWIPRTNGQLRGKYFHLMTSSCFTPRSNSSPILSSHRVKGIPPTHNSNLTLTLHLRPAARWPLWEWIIGGYFTKIPQFCCEPWKRCGLWLSSTHGFWIQICIYIYILTKYHELNAKQFYPLSYTTLYVSALGHDMKSRSIQLDTRPFTTWSMTSVNSVTPMRPVIPQRSK